MTQPDAPDAATARPASAPRRRRTRGALFVLAVFLGGSALIRLGEGIGEALAQDQRPPATEQEATEPLAEPAVSEDSAAGWPAVLAALQEREARLAAREEAFEDRLSALAVTEARTREAILELEAAEAALAATLALSDQAAERDLDRLTAVYEAMKPRDAAALFEEMAADFAAGFLARMHPESAAEILAGLTPHTAYTISVILAGRHALVPRE